jgi:hypothetical protein
MARQQVGIAAYESVLESTAGEKRLLHSKSQAYMRRTTVSGPGTASRGRGRRSPRQQLQTRSSLPAEILQSQRTPRPVSQIVGRHDEALDMVDVYVPESPNGERSTQSEAAYETVCRALVDANNRAMKK